MYGDSIKSRSSLMRSVPAGVDPVVDVGLAAGRPAIISLPVGCPNPFLPPYQPFFKQFLDMCLIHVGFLKINF